MNHKERDINQWNKNTNNYDNLDENETRAQKGSGGEKVDERINELRFREVGDEGTVTKKGGIKADSLGVLSWLKIGQLRHSERGNSRMEGLMCPQDIKVEVSGKYMGIAVQKPM